MQTENERKVLEFLLEAGIKLEARATTVASAALYCYKFLQKLPPDVSDVCPYTTAASCLYLAGKVEEDFLKIRDVTNVCHRILHPKDPPLEVGDLYWSIRDGLGYLELLVIRTLGFQLHINHPHTFLLQYLKTLKSWVDRTIWESTPIASTAWAILRDSYIYPQMHAHQQPQMMALAAVCLSLKSYGVTVLEDRNPWYKTVFPSASSSQLNQLTKDILTHVYPS